MFQIIGAMAEFVRSLIQERVKAGLRTEEDVREVLEELCEEIFVAQLAAGGSLR